MNFDELPRDQRADAVNLSASAQRYRETHGEEALEQLAASWWGPLNNRGKHLFGKTSMVHLTKRYQDASQPLWLRLVDYVKVNARYPRYKNAVPLLMYQPMPGELIQVLGDPEKSPETNRKALQRALLTSKRLRMFDGGSRLDLLMLTSGEWNKHRHSG